MPEKLFHVKQAARLRPAGRGPYFWRRWWARFQWWRKVKLWRKLHYTFRERIPAFVARVYRRLAPPVLLFGGWASLTFGIAQLAGAPLIVWPISTGILAVGLFGFRVVWVLFWYGARGVTELAKRQRLENRGWED